MSILRTTTGRKLITGLLIVMMGGHLINKALFTHSHLLPDGSIVTHAHPFNKGAEADHKHTHSLTDFLLLSLVDRGVLPLFSIALVIITPPLVLRRPQIRACLQIVYTPSPAGRAPPII